jgi:hypothetical protein
MIWKHPIFDRTSDDLRTLSTKAYINAEDLNRIEGNIEYLSTVLNKYAYHHQIVIGKTDWKLDDLPRISDIKRICENIMILVNSYPAAKKKCADVSNIPEYPLSIFELNRMELNLQMIKDYVETMTQLFKESGTFHANTNTILPLKQENFS